ncbi:MAG TPA: nitroreductase family protein [Clostridiales bacterium]|jgi:nitroreductase|nr:nitroreductase family protein [Clostridiales bacterium]
MLLDLLKKTRSYRNFDPKQEVKKDDLLEIINHCRFAPSAVNRQPVRFAYAYKKEDCERIFPNLAWAGMIKVNKPPYPGNEPTAYILLCYDTELSKDSPEVDMGIYAQTLVLSAAEKGLGACILGSINKPALSDIFGLPENWVPRLIVALGGPNEEIVLTDAVDGDTRYYRDEKGTHYVPKRPLEEIAREIGEKENS